MKTYFYIEPMRLRTSCQQAIENIKRVRDAKKRAAIVALCHELNERRWHFKPLPICWLLSKILEKPAPAPAPYNPDKLLSDAKYREAVFYDDCDDLELADFRCACVMGVSSENLCERLLSACAGSVAQGNISITVEDWNTVYSWSQYA